MIFCADANEYDPPFGSVQSYSRFTIHDLPDSVGLAFRDNNHAAAQLLDD